MNRWLIVALVLGSSCLVCSGAALVLALVAADEGGAGGSVGSADCPNVFQGWQQTIGARGLTFSSGDLVVEHPWPLEFTDALRSGDGELNVLLAVAGDRYEPQQLARGSYGERRLVGPALERATGRTVFISFTSGAMSGIANPVLAIAPDEASLLARFPNEGALLATQDLNRFSLGCATVSGRWKSGFSTAAERYAAGSGRFVGVEAVAAWRDLALDGDGSFRRESSALLNGVFHKSVDTGSWKNDGWSLVLETESGKTLTYDASLIAVQNGFLLRLADRQFTADIEEFQRGATAGGACRVTSGQAPPSRCPRRAARRPAAPRCASA